MAAPEPTHQWMHNPETGGDWECPVELVEMYVARGWETSDGPSRTDEHLYDDPNDPRIKVAPASSPAPVAHEEPAEPPLTPKQQLIAEAEALGLSTKGTIADLTARIEAAQRPPDDDPVEPPAEPPADPQGEPHDDPDDPGEITTTTEEQ